MSYTIRPNTAGSAWQRIERYVNVPPPVEQVRLNGRPKIIDAKSAAEIASWIAEQGWGLHEAPVFLEPLG